MGFRRHKGLVSRWIAAATLIAVVLAALACSRADTQPMIAVGQLKPDLVGHAVVITFVWKKSHFRHQGYQLARECGRD